jgi:hypothetical protein
VHNRLHGRRRHLGIDDAIRSLGGDARQRVVVLERLEVGRDPHILVIRLDSLLEEARRLSLAPESAEPQAGG